MHDSGKRQKFESGAVRDSADGKPRPDLQSPYAQERIGHWLRLGAEKYDERNWEAGMQFSRCIASLERHLVAYKMGKRDEDHLAAIAVNAQFLMHYEEMIIAGILPHTLDDMPHYTDKVTQPTSQPIHQVGVRCNDRIYVKAGEDIKAHDHSMPVSSWCTNCTLTSDRPPHCSKECKAAAHSVPQFKAGDKVRIKLREGAQTSADIIERCRKNDNEGRYKRYGFEDGDDSMHYAVIDGQEYVFYADELTLIEGD